MKKFSIHNTSDSKITLLLEHSPKRPNGRLICWLASESWGDIALPAMEQLDGINPSIKGPFTVNGKNIRFNDESSVIGICPSQTQAKRIAQALNQFAAVQQ